MSLLDRVRAAAGPAGPPPGGGSATKGFDFVDLPAHGAEKAAKRLDKRAFEALPLQERISLLVQGTLRFYRGDREVPASEAMRAAY